MRAGCKIRIGLGVLLGVCSGCFTSGYDGIPFESQSSRSHGNAPPAAMRADGKVGDSLISGDGGSQVNLDARVLTGDSSTCPNGCDANVVPTADSGSGIFDAGSVPSDPGVTDTGMPQDDSGTGEVDGGAWPTDGGLVFGDAGVLDGGISDGGGRDGGGTPSGLPGPVHHYTLDGTGTDAADGAGEAGGQLKSGASLTGTGSVNFGNSDGYVDLPNGILSELDSVTLIIWFRWHGGACGQTLFDLGSSGEGEDTQGESPNSLSVTPYSCSLLFGRFEGRYRGSQVFGEEEAVGRFRTAVDEEVLAMAAVAVDSVAGTLAVALHDTRSFYEQKNVLLDLSQLSDNNNWLGRSQVPGYPRLNAEVFEFRVYDYAMTKAQLELARDTGPDAL